MLSAKQRAVLSVVCETLLPEFREGPGEPVLSDVVERMEGLIDSLRDPGDRGRLLLLLTALESAIANLALNGRPASLTRMGPQDRLRVLDGWAHSRLGVRRAGFQALKRLANVAYYCWPTSAGTHPSWTASGYPGPLPQPERQIAALPVLAIDSDTTLECDVVVVGSGAGGGVVAGILAQAGRDVIVLEKGPALSSSDMTQVEGEMLGKAYLDSGLVMTQSGSMPILAGSCVGGGTVVNYTTSFRLPDNIRDEWTEVSGLKLFSEPSFTESLDRVCERLNVGTEWTTPGKRDALLEQGLKAKGWHVDINPRNVTDCPEGLECGYCGYGCRHGAKNDTARTYLADAVAAGARIVAGCSVDRITIERGKATGVSGTVVTSGGRAHLLVKARAVVAACGSIQTPALLKRSGVASPNVGRGLRLHPASAVMGIFPDRVEPWSGALQTRYSEQFAELEGPYGVRFETAPIHLALAASAFGWETARQYRNEVDRLGHTSLVGLLMRDRDPGRVVVTRAGLPRVHYDLSRRDAAMLHRGLVGGAEVLAAAGASEIVTLHSPPARAFTSQTTWLDGFRDQCASRGYRHNRMSFISFHQMATCAMGANPSKAVVSPTGETFETQRLYVADASTFPTSSGVNPMITIMAIADHVARALGSAL